MSWTNHEYVSERRYETGEKSKPIGEHVIHHKYSFNIFQLLLHNFRLVNCISLNIYENNLTLTAEKALFTRMSSWPLFSESILQIYFLILVGHF